MPRFLSFTMCNGRRAALACGAAVAATFATAGCADRPMPVVAVAMGDTTLPLALLGARQRRFNDSVGTRHAVKLILGAPLSGGAQPSAVAWADEVVQVPGIVGVVGHESSRFSLQAAPVYAKRGVVQIVPTGTSGQLATASPWTFPLVASDGAQGELIARHVVAMGRKRVTLFVQDDEYGRGIVASLEHALRDTDVEILENVMQTPASDYGLLVRSVLSHTPKPDALVLITQGSIAANIAQLLWEREPTLLIVGSDAATSGRVALRAMAPAPDRLALATYWLPDSTNLATQVFLRDYRAAGMEGEPQWSDAALYDAVGLLTMAAAESGGRPSAVRGWLQSLGRTRPAYQGVLGEIDFTGAHAIPARLVRPSENGWELVK